MLEVQKEIVENITVYHLTGSIEETVNFDKMLGDPSPRMDIYCKEITRINSIGVKAWIKYFQGATSKQSKLRFLECSSAIVEQMNMISNFNCGGLVESIYIPFSCVNCKTELIGLFKTQDIKAMNFDIPKLKCAKCGNDAVFDDLPEEYFGFLMR